MEATINLTLTPHDARMIEGLVKFAIESGGPLERMAAEHVTKQLSLAVMGSMTPEDRSELSESLDDFLAEHPDAPEEVRDTVDKIKSELEGEPLTEDAIAKTDMDELTDALRRSTDGSDPV